MKISRSLMCLVAMLLLNGCIVVGGHSRDHHARPHYDDPRSYDAREHHRGHDYR
ncbi:hypothetical protein [Lonsdalea iberica]|uniref:hypothetical protein n=1 Tax=Lonsdalea iberica TaxID=1082703 RepID=UPI0015941E83|nr:hypothetical protein [Lonsdalea iberica]